MSTALTPKQDDPVAKAIDIVLRTLVEVADAAQLIENNRLYALSIGESERGRTSSVRVCDACERPVMGTKEDPWRKGLCDTHYKAYMRWSQSQLDPDKQVWLREFRSHKVAV